MIECNFNIFLVRTIPSSTSGHAQSFFTETVGTDYSNGLSILRVLSLSPMWSHRTRKTSNESIAFWSAYRYKPVEYISMRAGHVAYFYALVKRVIGNDRSVSASVSDFVFRTSSAGQTLRRAGRARRRTGNVRKIRAPRGTGTVGRGRYRCCTGPARGSRYFIKKKKKKTRHKGCGRRARS